MSPTACDVDEPSQNVSQVEKQLQNLSQVPSQGPAESVRSNAVDESQANVHRDEQSNEQPNQTDIECGSISTAAPLQKSVNVPIKPISVVVSRVAGTHGFRVILEVSLQLENF